MFKQMEIKLKSKNPNIPDYEVSMNESPHTEFVYYGNYDVEPISTSGWFKPIETGDIKVSESPVEYVIQLEYREFADGNLDNPHESEWHESPQLIFDGGVIG